MTLILDTENLHWTVEAGRNERTTAPADADTGERGPHYC